MNGRSCGAPAFLINRVFVSSIRKAIWGRSNLYMIGYNMLVRYDEMLRRVQGVEIKRIDVFIKGLESRRENAKDKNRKVGQWILHDLFMSIHCK